MAEQTDSFKKGIQDFHNYFELEDNPYPRREIEDREKWIMGWLFAKYGLPETKTDSGEVSLKLL